MLEGLRLDSNVKLENYWPSVEEKNKCVKSLADNVSESVLLAVHQPMSFECFEITNLGEKHSIGEKGQEDLLNAFFHSSSVEQYGYLLQMITGRTGTGKSHAVLWLAAQLSRDSRADNMHVIRIPKSTTLRGVIELILEPVAKNKDYANILKELDRINSDLDIAEATVQFAAQLENKLNGLSPSDYPLAKSIPFLFNDPAFRSHYLEEVFEPLIGRAVEGQHSEIDEDRFQSEFTPEQFLLPSTINVGEASDKAANFYSTKVESSRRGESNREKMARAMNDICDEAVSEVFSINRAAGGRSFSDLIKDIRSLFLKEGKEIVLLVEDFVTLKGIQRELLDAAIEPGKHEEQEVLCTMRTVVAVTEGELSGYDTVMVRAQKEWKITQSQKTAAEQREDAINMVGAYLNAARWGIDEINKKFAKVSRENSDLTNWLEVYNDEKITIEEADLLTRFGESGVKVPLFPFNKACIRNLIERRRTRDEGFNPRDLITYVLHFILDMRRQYEEGSFPNFGETSNLDMSVAQFLSNKGYGEQDKNRLNNFVYAWADNPSTVEGIGLQPSMFEIFNLPNIYMDTDIEIDDVEDEDEKGEDEEGQGEEEVVSSTSSLEDDGVKEKVDEFIVTMNEWAGGTRLLEKLANELRKIMRDALVGALDAESLRVKADFLEDFPQQRLHIENAEGNNRAEIRIIETNEDGDGTSRSQIVALYRQKMYNDVGQFTYPDFDKDLIEILNFVEQHKDKVEQWVIDRAEKKVSSVSTLISLQSRVLGVGNVDFDSSVAELVSEAVRNLSVISKIENVSEELEMRKVSDFLKLRTETAKCLKATMEPIFSASGCYQGRTGKRTLAIDPTRFPDGFVEENLLDISSYLDQPSSKIASQYRPVRIRGLIEGCIKEIKKFSVSFAREICEFGELTQFSIDSRKMLEALVNSGVWSSEWDYEGTLKLLGELESKDLGSFAENIKRLSSESSWLMNLDALGNLDFENLVFLNEFKNHFFDVVEKIDRVLGNEEIQNRGQEVGVVQKELLDDLELLAVEIQEHVVEGL